MKRRLTLLALLALTSCGPSAGPSSFSGPSGPSSLFDSASSGPSSLFGSFSGGGGDGGETLLAVPRFNTPGALCGNPGLTGRRVAPVTSSTSGCGIARPVKITAVNGLTLSQPATVDCATANSLSVWVDGAVKAAYRDARGLRVAASYSCRTRNHRAGARLSEHAKGKAIDISGITLASGRTVTLLEGWGRGADGRKLRRLHRAACGPFGTVLGPESDSYHRDHFHFDTASYRGGPYCK